MVRSDEHPAYPRALRRLAGYAIRHERTPSVAARTAGNPLFPVNLLDLLLRHNSAHHKRETIAFTKRHQAVIERAALLLRGATSASRSPSATAAARRRCAWGCDPRRSPARAAGGAAVPVARGAAGAVGGLLPADGGHPGDREPHRHALKRAF